MGSSNDSVKVHNGDLYLDILQNADWSPSPNCTEPTAAMKKLHEARLYAAAQPGRHANNAAHSPSGSPSRNRLPDITAMSKQRVEQEFAATERANRLRDAFVQKQRVREEETKQRLEQSMKDTQRRARERAVNRENDFEMRCAAFCDANASIIEEINATVMEEEEWLQRKRERLFAEWTAQVFLPMQSQIDDQLRNMTHADIAQKRRYMFQCFLDESNRKRGGVFRDIIMECDYDPLAMCKEATIGYRSVPVTEDPTKNRSTREGGDETLVALKHMSASEVNGSGDGEGGCSTAATSRGRTVGGAESGGGSLGLGAPRETTLPVTLWDRIDVTPYGRYHSEGRVGNMKKPQFNRSSVKMDHYNVPTSAEGSKLLSVELQCKGKKVYGKPMTNIF